MDWDKFYKEKAAIEKNLDEWTDDIIRSDGSIGVVSGSNADTCRYEAEEEREFAELMGWEE